MLPVNLNHYVEIVERMEGKEKRGGLRIMWLMDWMIKEDYGKWKERMVNGVIGPMNLINKQCKRYNGLEQCCPTRGLHHMRHHVIHFLPR